MHVPPPPGSQLPFIPSATLGYRVALRRSVLKMKFQVGVTRMQWSLEEVGPNRRSLGACPWEETGVGAVESPSVQEIEAGGLQVWA